jgi:membrane-bound metal-dependent hydrolase YbcI (DUF457 family)
MMGPTHFAGGALAGLAVSYGIGLGLEQAAALTAGAIATSKLPDIDAEVKRGPDHRSFPHSLVIGGGVALMVALVVWGTVLTGAANGLIYALPDSAPVSAATLNLAVAGGVLGYFTHLLLDAMTRSGIWLLMPKGKALRLPKRYSVRIGGVGEWLVSGVMVVCALMLGLAVFGPVLDGAALAIGGV